MTLMAGISMRSSIRSTKIFQSYLVAFVELPKTAVEASACLLHVIFAKESA